MAGERILVLDNEPTTRNAAITALTAHGYEVAGAPFDRGVFEVLGRQRFDLLVVNSRRMPTPATQIVQLLRKTSPSADILLLCDNQNVLEAVNALGGIATSMFSLSRLGAAVEGVRKRRQSMMDHEVASILATPLEANRRLASGEPIESAAQAVLQSLTTDIGADYVSLRLLDIKNEQRGRSIQTTFSMAIPSYDRSGAADAIESRVTEAERPVLFLDGTSKDIALDRELVRAGVSSALSLPLINNGRLVGILTAIVFAPREPFSQNAVNLSLLVAANFAMGATKRGSAEVDLENSLREAELRDIGRKEEIKRLSDEVETLSASQREGNKRFLQALRALTATIDAREVTRQGHSQAVEQLAVSLAERMRLPGSGVVEAALLYDVGMLAVPDAILSAKRRLTKKEWALITNHSLMSEELAKNIGLGEEVLLAIRHHHENYDGTGYPNGLVGENIPQLARLLRVADTYVAIRSARPWRKALDPQQAIHELRQAAGTLYDSDIVAALAEMVNTKVVDEAEREGGAELISTLSHELRSPLTSLIGYSELLSLQPDLPTPAREAAVEIKEEALYMSRLVDTLLNIGRGGIGAMRLDRQPVNLGELIRSRMRRYESVPGKHEFLTEIPDNLPVLFIDPDRVNQILTNLVDNAIKFSPNGGHIKIAVICDSGQVEVSVDDEGIGISETDIDRIFEIFYRSESAVVRSVRGSGLGLAICKNVIEAHGGRIWALNRKGEGSTFKFTLPIQPWPAE